MYGLVIRLNEPVLVGGVAALVAPAPSASVARMPSIISGRLHLVPPSVSEPQPGSGS